MKQNEHIFQSDFSFQEMEVGILYVINIYK